MHTNITFDIAGTLPVTRLGFGAMRLGPDIWDPRADTSAAQAVARRAVELGVTFIDTADSYGPAVNEDLLAAALYPYPKGLVIATKAGQARPGPGQWVPLGRPEYLRQQAELSRYRLRVECIDLFQLHRIDPQVPLADQMGALRDLQDAGTVRHVGLSEVSVEQIKEARDIVEVASVQNLYNLYDRRHEAVLDYCEQEGIAFIPWLPVANGAATRRGGPLDRVAAELGASPIQVSLAWLLARSPIMVPIPGTSSIRHLEENVAAARLRLNQDQFDLLAGVAG